MLVSGYAFGEETKSDPISGKYQATGTEANITGTHTHAWGKYLLIDTSKAVSAVYFSSDNGDIEFGRKLLLTLSKTDNNKYDLQYAGCITQSFIGDVESSCISSEAIGKIIYEIEISGQDVRIINKEYAEESENILKKVTKFDFE